MVPATRQVQYLCDYCREEIPWGSAIHFSEKHPGKGAAARHRSTVVTPGRRRTRVEILKEVGIRIAVFFYGVWVFGPAIIAMIYFGGGNY